MRFLIFLLLIPCILQADYFASIKSNKTNMRVGPGLQYTINWTYIKRHLPVKVIDQYEQWCKIQDIDNTVGWIHQSLLSRKRYLVVTKKTIIYAKQNQDSKVLANVDARVVVKLQECQEQWCSVEVQRIKGFIHQDDVWGID